MERCGQQQLVRLPLPWHVMLAALRDTRARCESVRPPATDETWQEEHATSQGVQFSGERRAVQHAAGVYGSTTSRAEPHERALAQCALQRRYEAHGEAKQGADHRRVEHELHWHVTIVGTGKGNKRWRDRRRERERRARRR